MRKTLFSVLSALCATVVMAEINDSEKNTITTEGFPPDLPCIMKTMYMADKINAWDKVSYDKGIILSRKSG